MVAWSRYLGKWYEVARTPNPFQRTCDGRRVDAEYTRVDERTIRIVNSCTSVRGVQTARGVGRIVSDTAMRVIFGVPSPLVHCFGATYEVVYVDQAYTFAIVRGSERSRFVWFLSRSPTVTLRQYKEMKRVAMDVGLDVRHLRRTAPAEARVPQDERTAGHDAERRFR